MEHLIFFLLLGVLIVSSVTYVDSTSCWRYLFLFLLSVSGGLLSGMYSDVLQKAETYEQKYNQLLISTQKPIEIPTPTTE